MRYLMIPVVVALCGLGIGLFESYINKDGSPQSLESLQHDVSRCPICSDAHVALSRGLIMSGRHRDAIESAKEAVRLSPSSGSTYGALGMVLQDTWSQSMGKVGSMDAALRAFKDSVQVAPEDAEGKFTDTTLFSSHLLFLFSLNSLST